MPEAKYKIPKKCRICGRTFYAKSMASTCCSPECSTIMYRQNRREKRRQAKLEKVREQIPDNVIFLTVSEAIAVFEVGKNSIYRLIKKNKISHFKKGLSQILVLKQELAQLFHYRNKSNDETETLPRLFYLAKEDCYTIGEITEIFKVSEKSVYTHIRRYSIPIRQIGKFVYAPKKEIDHIYR